MLLGLLQLLESCRIIFVVCNVYSFFFLLSFLSVRNKTNRYLSVEDLIENVFENDGCTFGYLSEAFKHLDNITTIKSLRDIPLIADCSHFRTNGFRLNYSDPIYDDYCQDLPKSTLLPGVYFPGLYGSALSTEPYKVVEDNGKTVYFNTTTIKEAIYRNPRSSVAATFRVCCFSLFLLDFST